MAASCIICNQESRYESVEHIVPSSLGNIHYILPKGVVCVKCNNKFSRFESKVVSSNLFFDEKIRLGILPYDSDTSMSAVSKKSILQFTVKIGYESLYHSQNKIWNLLPHLAIKNFLLYGEEPPFIHDKVPDNLAFYSIPKWLNKWRLQINHIKIMYGKQNERIYIQFQFGKLILKARIK